SPYATFHRLHPKPQCAIDPASRFYGACDPSPAPVYQPPPEHRVLAALIECRNSDHRKSAAHENLLYDGRKFEKLLPPESLIPVLALKPAPVHLVPGYPNSTKSATQRPPFYRSLFVPAPAHLYPPISAEYWPLESVKVAHSHFL